jgi:hypothetical protein
MKRERVENLPEPFRTGMMKSNLWKNEEQRGGLPVTNCLSLYMPKTGDEDVLAVLRLGFERGWKTFDLLGLGDPNIFNV